MQQWFTVSLQANNAYGEASEAHTLSCGGGGGIEKIYFVSVCDRGGDETPNTWIYCILAKFHTQDLSAQNLSRVRHWAKSLKLFQIQFQNMCIQPNFTNTA